MDGYSSSSDIGDSISDYSSDASSSDSSDVEDGVGIQGVILGYQFEPVGEDSGEESGSDEEVSDDDQQEAWRLRMEDSDKWCKCGGRCEVQDTLEENACCTEKGPVQDTIDEFNREHGGDITCITEHPGFQSNCLDVWVLRTAYTHYRQQYRTRVEGETNAKYRYIAYRQFVRWCWGILGKKNRVPLPACVLERIRLKFWAVGDNIGFKYPAIGD